MSGDTSKSEKGSGTNWLFLPEKILSPSAEFIGGELKEVLKRKFDSFKAKKEDQNISGHLSRAQMAFKATSSPEGTITQLTLFQDWYEGAKSIDPGEGPIAEMWQKLLAAIHDGEHVTDEMITKLKSLSSLEAELLLRYRVKTEFYPQDGREFSIIKGLIQKGLLEDSLAGPTIRGFILFPVVSLLLCFGGLAFLLPYLDTRNVRWAQEKGIVFSTYILSSFLVATIFVALATGIYLLYKRLSRYRWVPVRMSWIARELVGFVNWQPGCY